MRHDSAIHAPLTCEGVFTSTSSCNCKQTRNLKREIKGRTSCLPCSC